MHHSITFVLLCACIPLRGLLYHLLVSIIEQVSTQHTHYLEPVNTHPLLSCDGSTTIVSYFSFPCFVFLPCTFAVHSSESVLHSSTGTHQLLSELLIFLIDMFLSLQLQFLHLPVFLYFCHLCLPTKHLTLLLIQSLPVSGSTHNTHCYL